MPDSQRVDLPDVSLHYWEWVAEQLAPTFRVLAPDQRGHGDSGRPASGASAGVPR
jgi:pimeloyl-ACP methyl ester carboxylesterase